MKAAHMLFAALMLAHAAANEVSVASIHLQVVPRANGLAVMPRSFFCPHQFVPGHHGFQDEDARRGCCVLGKSLAYMELIYRCVD